MSLIEGLDVHSVEAWLSTHLPTIEQPLRWARLEGGHSNLTFVAEGVDGRRVVVRRPPLGPLHPRAHDVAREYRVVSALVPTAIPVPKPLGLCRDVAVTGAPFYVMDFVQGQPLTSLTDVALGLPDVAAQRTAVTSYFDTIADLHTLDPDAIGLGDLARRDDFVGRQLSTWYRSWVSFAEDAAYDDARVHTMHATLLARKPDPGPVRLVHCDLGLHNCLFDRRGEVVSVLDWEICTLGDPRFDLAYALARSVGSVEIPGHDGAVWPETFPTAAEMLARYEERTGSRVEDLPYFTALNRWRWACVTHGVYARYVRGQKSADGVDLGAMRRMISTRLDQAEQAFADLH